MNITSMTPAHRPVVAFGAAMTLLTVGACSSNDAGHSTSNAASTKVAPMATAMTATDTWVKAAPSDMSAAFGTLKNTGTKPITLTSVTGDRGPMQLHVTQKTANGMEMKETKSFTIPAGGNLTLQPGGSHIMFMKLTAPLEAGTTQKLTVRFQDGSTKGLDFPVRAYDGAKEKYPGSSAQASSMTGMTGMSGMSGTGSQHSTPDH